MGRFFKAKESTLLDDVIYETPTDLMKEALKANDDLYDSGQDTLDLLEEEIGKIKVMNLDEEEKTKILDEYNQRRDDVINAMNTDKVNFKRYLPKVQSLSRDFSRDIAQGRLKQLNDNMIKRDTLFKKIDTDTTLDKDYGELIKQNLYNNYRNTARQLFAEDVEIKKVVDRSNFIKRLKEVLRADKKDVSITKKDGGGRYFYIDEDNSTILSKDKVKEGVKNASEIADLRNQLIHKYSLNPNITEQEAEALADKEVNNFIDNVTNQLYYEETSEKDDYKEDKTAHDKVMESIGRTNAKTMQERNPLPEKGKNFNNYEYRGSTESYNKNNKQFERLLEDSFGGKELRSGGLDLLINKINNSSSLYEYLKQNNFNINEMIKSLGREYSKDPKLTPEITEKLLKNKAAMIKVIKNNLEGNILVKGDTKYDTRQIKQSLMATNVARNITVRRNGGPEPFMDLGNKISLDLLAKKLHLANSSFVTEEDNGEKGSFHKIEKKINYEWNNKALPEKVSDIERYKVTKINTRTGKFEVDVRERVEALYKVKAPKLKRWDNLTPEEKDSKKYKPFDGYVRNSSGNLEYFKDKYEDVEIYVELIPAK